jgi:hypothetical protein
MCRQERFIDRGLGVPGGRGCTNAAARRAKRGYRGFRACPRRVGEGAVNAEGLPEPKDSHEYHEEQRQYYGSLYNFGGARAAE